MRTAAPGAPADRAAPTAAAGASSGGAGDGASSDGASTGGSDTAGSGTGGGGTAGQQVPAGSPLPECKPAAVRLSLRTKVSYGPDDRPKFELIAKNTSSATCKTDLGPKSAVLTVTEAGGEDDDPIWSSKDCPAAVSPLFLKVPAGATVIHTVDWNRTLSAPGCATPPAGKAGPGNVPPGGEDPGRGGPEGVVRPREGLTPPSPPLARLGQPSARPAISSPSGV